MNDLSEKVIVIMGASSGIGEATTKLLAEKGAKLVIAARRKRFCTSPSSYRFSDGKVRSNRCIVQ